jgi:hypothetical protein
MLAALAPRPARAIRPFVTDDARVVGGKLLQLETWVLVDRLVLEHNALVAVGPTDWLELTAGLLHSGIHSGADRGLAAQAAAHRRVLAGDLGFLRAGDPWRPSWSGNIRRSGSRGAARGKRSGAGAGAPVGAIVVLAAVDYGWRVLRHRQRLQMSHHDVRRDERDPVPRLSPTSRSDGRAPC